MASGKFCPVFVSFWIGNQTHSGISPWILGDLEKQLTRSGLFIILVRHLCNVKSDPCGIRQICFARSSYVICLYHAYNQSIQNTLCCGGRQN